MKRLVVGNASSAFDAAKTKSRLMGRNGGECLERRSALAGVFPLREVSSASVFFTLLPVHHAPPGLAVGFFGAEVAAFVAAFFSFGDS